MQKIVVASNNQGKINEIKDRLKDLPYQIVSLKDEEINIDVVEDGKTYEENAIKKAKEICEVTNEVVIADDSGMEIKAMPGELGVYSARFMGHDTDSKIKNDEILKRLEGLKKEDRACKYVAVIAIAYPSGKMHTIREECNGYISQEAEGDMGFGYDPIFYVEEYKKTFAQVSKEEKGRISHRGKALTKLIEYLENK